MKSFMMFQFFINFHIKNTKYCGCERAEYEAEIKYVHKTG